MTLIIAYYLPVHCKQNFLFCFFGNFAVVCQHFSVEILQNAVLLLYVPVRVSGDGEAYVVAHRNGQAWEVLQTRVENGVVYAFFPSGF